MRTRGTAPRPGDLRRYRGWSEYLPFVAAAVSLTAALIAFLTTGTTNTDIKLLVGFTIALSAMSVPLQLEALVRIAERVRAREQHGRLLELTEEHPELLPVLVKITEASVATLESTRVPEFREHVTSILVETQVRLQELAQGRLRTTSGDNALLERFTETESLLQATTDEHDTGWWRQANGKRFFEENKELRHRGVTVERVWVLGREPDEATRKVIDGHHRAQISVYVVRADHVDGPSLVNMTMMDQSFLHEDIPNKQGQAGEYLFSENSTDLERARRRFTRLKARAIQYEGSDSLDELFPRVSSSDVPTA